jgi:Fe-S cluster assembly protein SufD
MMTGVMEERSIHVANFSRLGKQVDMTGNTWLDELRKRGMARFEEVGFPKRDEEEWRFTDVRPIAAIAFKLAETIGMGREAAGRFSFGKEAMAELVFVNGQFSSELSKLERLPRGVKVSSLAQMLDSDPAVLERHLGKLAEIEANPFVALNTGFVRDGAVVHIGRGVAVEGPIHLLFIGAPAKEPLVSHPRVLVVAEENSAAQIVESYVGAGAGVYFTNAVAELVLGDHARIDHCKLQQEGPDAFHVATMQATLGRSAVLISQAATIGGKLTRNDLNVSMDGEGADATLNGLVIARGEMHVDNHTLLKHEKPKCLSHELYKHVLNDKATAVFKGQIFVQKDAQKTDSKQTSKALLLSDEAVMNSMPALEIYADDVKCTHGSTIGPVDEEMVFYLRSRGVSLESARHLLTYAFAADITRRIKVAPVRRRLEDFMAAQHGLPQDLRITDLGSHDEAAL